MTTNFDFLAIDQQFVSFASKAAEAELVFGASFQACALMCRTALEVGVKWMYSVDNSLALPYDKELLAVLMGNSDFVDLLPTALLPQLNYIRKLGNTATHTQKVISQDQAVLALKNLHSFMDFIAYCYGTKYVEHVFDEGLLSPEALDFAPEMQNDLVGQVQVTVDFENLRKENEQLRATLSARREEQLKTPYDAKPMDFTEAQTRNALIDTMLQDAGWERGKNWVDEFPIDQMPNKSNIGKADYVLFGDDGSPLAVIEAKRTSINQLEVGRQQAKLYADFLEKKFGQRPIIFLTNGYETRIWNDNHYPERSVSGIYSKRDLEQEFNLMRQRKPLRGVLIDDQITNRYYQKEAIQAVCDSFDQRNRRKALLVMATGSGKTRVVISLVDVLIKYGWVKNVLFLADRNALVRQAKGAFYQHMSDDITLCNLVEERESACARLVFSTYQTMMGAIDDVTSDDGGRLFSPGHFDLIIVDEAHRSIYRKYQNIFDYFDALLVGLTATPKDEVDKNTYGIFELPDGMPTYGYELTQAVTDGFLVDYRTLETGLKFMTQGITYDELSAEEQLAYEETFSDEDGTAPALIEPTAMNEWVFNHDTIAQVLHILMEHGQHVDYGQKIGKTIIFAKNHNHAQKIVEVWGQEFPHYDSHYCQVIDNKVNYAQSLIDDFGEAHKFPQIAVSVDMLDTGIDVPEVLNLVFFKKVLSRAKFWQMLGRGTRLCPGLLDGQDKKEFFIFDLCGNFAFFRTQPKGLEPGLVVTLQERLFNIKIRIIRELQDVEFQTEELRALRSQLVDEAVAAVGLLNREAFDVRQHLRFVDKFSRAGDYLVLSGDDATDIANHVAPLILPSDDHVSASRFDALIHQIELALLQHKPFDSAKRDLISKAKALSKCGTIPAVAEQKELLTALSEGYLDAIDVLGYEDIRLRLRNLLIFIPYEEQRRYETNFTDEILYLDADGAKPSGGTLDSYRKSVEWYLLQHEDEPAIAKVKNNVPLAEHDIRQLETYFWVNLGTREQYEANFGSKPVGELVRSIVGLSQEAANEAFSQFLNTVQLDSKQMRFVKLVVDYIVKRGLIEDFSVLQGSPFSDRGSFAEIFDSKTFMDFKRVIEEINGNATAA